MMKNINKKFNVLNLLSKILSKVFNKKMIRFSKLYIYEVNLKSFESNHNPDFYIKQASGIEEIQAIINEKGGQWGEVYTKWFNDGNKCIMGLKDNKLAGIMWVFQNNEITIEFNYKYKLNTDEAFLNDGYILQNQRKKGVFKLIHYGIIENAENIGFKKLYSTILAKNRISIIANYNLDVKNVIAILYRFNIYKFSILHLKKLAISKNINEYVNYLDK